MSRKHQRGSPTPTRDEEQSGTSRSWQGTPNGEQEAEDVPESSHRVPDPTAATVDVKAPADPTPTRKRNRSPTKAKASLDLTHHQSESEPRHKRRDADSKSKATKRRMFVPQADAPEASRLVDPEGKAATAIEPISELPYVEPVYILLQAEKPKPPRLVDTAVGTDPGRAHSNPSARRHPPSVQVKNRVTFSDTAVNESDIDQTSSSPFSSDSSALYDLEDHEILITKTEKFYKKRADKVLPLVDSDESFEVLNMNRPQHEQRRSLVSRVFEEQMDSDAPQSIDHLMMSQYTDLSDSSTSSGTKLKRGQGLGLSAGNLDSGYVFVNLHGHPARWWLRLDRARPQLPGPADCRWRYLLDWHLVALHGQGLWVGQLADCVCGQHTDWLLLHGRRLLQRPDQQLRLSAGGPARCDNLFIVHAHGQLQPEPGHDDCVLQHHCSRRWPGTEHDLGELAAHHRLLL
ncbi:uncharacterized protein LOC117581525 isoform X3 [Drosophila guanche]|uniref:uncharacterized protein LOC117581525 isoform X3 n=1 Tax=Drosophila guanche TaxID=7266 RepID=UPI001470ADF4|nr:uncharacterized protein LOC117581525 isoform X3 [Drosophila guanche]